MESFKVIDKNGIHHEGEHIAKGQTVAIGKGAALNAFIHFNQVEPVKAKAEDPDAAAKAKAEAEQKAKDEAEAKAKADAAAKK